MAKGSVERLLEPMTLVNILFIGNFNTKSKDPANFRISEDAR